MEKSHQQKLTCWLKQQSIISRYWLNISRLLGIISGFLIIAQSWLLAHILHRIIIKNVSKKILLSLLITLLVVFVLRSLIIWLRGRIGFHAGQHIRCTIRRQILERLQLTGPAWIQKKPTGSWVTLILEQVDHIHDYYAYYLPQMSIAICVPLMITITIFPINWIAALILLSTIPFILMFIVIIGLRASEANRRNIQTLTRLSGHFLDRLRGIDTMRLFYCFQSEIKNIYSVSQDLRLRTMEVLRLAFLSSSIIECFASLAISVIAIYFSSFYFNKLNFNHYNVLTTLSSGFLTLILAPEFFKPLRDFNAFYHAKSQAIGAADSLKAFFEQSLVYPTYGSILLDTNKPLVIEAKDLCIFSPEGNKLSAMLNFKLLAGQRVALVGRSGSGKSSLFNAILGFLSYTGSLLINGVELRDLNLKSWRAMLGWIGQNPQLINTTLRNNLLLSCSKVDNDRLCYVLQRAMVNDFLSLLPNGLDTIIGNQGTTLSAGQVQRVAIARALIKPCQLLLLDEPTASLDINSEYKIMNLLNSVSRIQSTLMITHQFDNITDWDSIWVMEDGRIVEQGSYSILSSQHGIFSTLLANRHEKII